MDITHLVRDIFLDRVSYQTRSLEDYLYRFCDAIRRENILCDREVLQTDICINACVARKLSKAGIYYLYDRGLREIKGCAAYTHDLRYLDTFRDIIVSEGCEAVY